MRRPTAAPAPSPNGAGVLLIDALSFQDETILKRTLSQQELPVWRDSDTPLTDHPPAASSTPPRSGPSPTSQLEGTLTIMDGSRAGRVVALVSQQTTLGRSPKASVHLIENGVSRKHARICWVDGRFILEDLQSRNGTRVNGRSIQAVKLQHGDVIRLGTAVALRFCWMDAHQKNLLNQLYESSVRDPLTGAFNRRHFAGQLDEEVVRAQRNDASLSLLLLDADHFKSVNDTYGHAEGDRVLRELAVVCQEQLRPEDLFARYGGEEFAVLLRCTTRAAAYQTGERLRARICEKIFVGEPPKPITVSIGCASLSCASNSSASALVQVADERLYEAKRNGRNRVVATGSKPQPR